MTRLPRPERYPRPPRVPPRIAHAPNSGTRVPIGPDALRAAYSAHQGDQHGGKPGRRCPTCWRYSQALTDARAAARAADEASP